MRRLLVPLLLLALSTLTSDVVRAETRQFQVTRDLWLSSHAGEEEASNGATPRLKFKGYQEFSLVDFDLSELKNKTIKRATLRLKCVGDERLYRVGVGTITSDWNEGTGTNYAHQEGASSYRWKANPNVPWIDAQDEASVTDYSDITCVMFGEGGSFWRNADATEPEDDYQYVDVAPEVVAARVAGLSYGFVLFDDTGTEVIQDGEDAIIRLFPNRFVYSHEQNRACEPMLEVEFEDSDDTKSPSSPADASFDATPAPRGTANLSWTQNNCLTENILGFRLRLDGEDVSQTQVPSPILGDSPLTPEETQSFHACLRGLDPAVKHSVEIVAVDMQGHESKPASVEFSVSDKAFDSWERIVNYKSDAVSSQKNAAKSLPTIGKSDVAVIQELDRIFESGELVPAATDKYLSENAIWNAASRTIDLASARNEFVGFQIAFNGPAQKMRFEVEWDGDSSAVTAPTAEFSRLARVNSDKGRVADPVIPLDSQKRVASLEEGADTILCELFVPAAAKAGVMTGKLRLMNEKREKLELNIRLTVWDFVLPNELCFLPEMNCYSLPSNELEYYRMAQLHRTYINRVPYSHRGSVGDGLAPDWNSSDLTFSWEKWTERFGKYFDGSAFADLPRGAVPIEAFYLPLFENFPGDVFKGFAGDFTWPDASAFTEEYQKAMTAGCRGFAEKIAEEGWDQTRFFFFLNNKHDYKKNGWYRASSPWLLDEPASYRDFAALAFFGKILKNSVADAPELQDKIIFRADISRPQWERNSLDSILDVYVVGDGTFRMYNPMIRNRSERSTPRFAYAYGTTTPPSESAYQPVFWSLDAWTTGADGIVPWQTIGNHESWEKEDELSLFYPATKESDGKVAASIRLKAYRSGEQLVEYLAILARETGRSRDEISRAVRNRLRLDKSSSTRTSEEDAGTSRYSAATADDLENFRRELGEYLNRSVQ